MRLDGLNNPMPVESVPVVISADKKSKKKPKVTAKTASMGGHLTVNLFMRTRQTGSDTTKATNNDLLHYLLMMFIPVFFYLELTTPRK
jgi:hypothetical protein